jgi:hypothetical protein
MAAPQGATASAAAQSVPRRSRRNALIAVGGFVLALILVAGFVGSLPSGGTSSPPSSPHTTVIVTTVNWQFSGPSNCWSSNSTSGTSVQGGSHFAVSIRLSYTAGLLQPTSCTVQSVGVSTSGFGLVNSNAPLVVDSGGSGTLSVTLAAPNSNVTEALTLVASVSSP